MSEDDKKAVGCIGCGVESLALTDAFLTVCFAAFWVVLRSKVTLALCLSGFAILMLLIFCEIYLKHYVKKEGKD